MELLVWVNLGGGIFARQADTVNQREWEFDNAQLNFVSDFATLLAAKVALMQQNRTWGKSA